MAKDTTPKSALSEVEGVQPLGSLNPNAIALRKKKRNSKPDAMLLFQGICSENRTALSQAITLVESQNEEHRAQAAELISLCNGAAKPSIRLGITGVPGVGKSTFIEAFGLHLTRQGKKVAVLAIDPSSPISGGSILGDKTRMEQLTQEPLAFIRPSAAGKSLGGVAQATRETLSICEAYGFDYILIETVGVGQSETAVRQMVDGFILLQLAGAGDELQGIKRGIMEMADFVILNKADGFQLPLIKQAVANYKRALHYFPAKESDWKVEVMSCSSLLFEGFDAIHASILKFEEQLKSNGFWQTQRKKQDQAWMVETFQNLVWRELKGHSEFAQWWKEANAGLEKHNWSPFAAASYVFDSWTKKR